MSATGPGVTRARRERKPSAKLLAACELVEEEQEIGSLGGRHDSSGDSGERLTPPPPKRKRRSTSTGEEPSSKGKARRTGQRTTKTLKVEHQLEAIEELEAWQGTGSNSSSQESFDIKEAECATYSHVPLAHDALQYKVEFNFLGKQSLPCRRKQKHPHRSPFS